MSETVLSARVLRMRPHTSAQKDFNVRMRPHFSAQKGFNAVCVCVSVAQSCPTLATPWTVAQARVLEMVAISFSKSMYSNWRQLKCNVICKVMKPNIYI